MRHIRLPYDISNDFTIAGHMSVLKSTFGLDFLQSAVGLSQMADTYAIIKNHFSIISNSMVN